MDVLLGSDRDCADVVADRTFAGTDEQRQRQRLRFKPDAPGEIEQANFTVASS
jgi:hypothetical protein